MRVLVTGGAGYIGSHTVLELIAAGHEVCILDNYANSSPEVLRRLRVLTNAEFDDTEGDVRLSTDLLRVFEEFRPEAVIHFAGFKAVGESRTDPVGYYETNVGGTLALLKAMDAMNCKSMIFSSSATVYGEPDYLPFDETHPTRPTNVYGRTKLMCEDIIRDWTVVEDTRSGILLRYFNPVGAHASAKIGEDPEGIPNNLMPFIAQVAVGRREKLSIFGGDYDTKDGTGVRDYIHVTDLAKAHVAAVDYTQAPRGAEVFNIGTSVGYSVLEMVQSFAKASGRDIPYEITDRRLGDVAEMLADPSKAAEKMNWRAELGLDDMCKSTWDWQEQNPDGFTS